MASPSLKELPSSLPPAHRFCSLQKPERRPTPAKPTTPTSQIRDTHVLTIPRPHAPKLAGQTRDLLITATAVPIEQREGDPHRRRPPRPLRPRLFQRPKPRALILASSS